MSNGYIFEGNLNSSDNVTSLEETFSSDFDFNGLRRGDRIQVFSSGNQIDGNGTFIGVQDGFLIWTDSSDNINATSLDAISISRIAGTA
ncbi:hypothetical protein [Priestia megaterium]|jgi:hypothetical protein|uniref:hypothetical protein n=1 Tax=Priestia megaterium TaxID=1404 RepID=UPI0006F2A241|nr:hypothetical protein [Priestia megaterium]KQU13948.1 hypothetical protein ASG61_29960 [Bacillus sp. Leaf75]USL27652.1 hypothetical protein LIT33_28345 [Priestia megaterium]USL33653.1 hypothetical protein LIT30_28500 [Priestia megaterium]WDM31713.1 hypothetical protein J8N01_01080 [Priestia megaterium]